MNGNFGAHEAARPATNVRVSDADRDAAAAELGSHFEAGRLTAAELDDRVGHALRARTSEDLDVLLADLPRAAPRQTTPGAGGRGRPVAWFPLAGLVIVAVVVAAAGFATAAGPWHGHGHGYWAPWWLIPLAIIAARQWRRRGWQHDRAARGWR